MRISILCLALLTIAVVAQDNEAVIQLLGELRQEAFEQLSLLDVRFQPIKQAKLDQITAIQQALSDQNGECYNRQLDVETKQNEIDGANQYKAWMRARQDSNNNRIGVLSTNVCEKNNNYIDNVKNARILLRLIAFLRASLQSQQSSSSLVEVKENTISEISHMVQAYKEYKRMNMLQTNQEYDLNGTIDQLIDILNQMEKEIQDDVANGQNGQVQVGVTFSEFKVRLEKENDVFERQIQVQDDLITHYQNQLTTLYGRVDKCQARLKEVQYTLLVAQEDLRYDIDGNNEDRAKLQEEIELFDWLIQHYQSGNLNDDQNNNTNSVSSETQSDENNDNNTSVQQDNVNNRDGVIDYTPLKEISNAWDQSETDEQQQTQDGDQIQTNDNNNQEQQQQYENNEDRGVIDYTPFEEQEENWDALVQKKQKKQSPQVKKHIKRRK